MNRSKVTYLALATSILFSQGCMNEKEWNQKLARWELLKRDVETQIESLPYRRPQHEAFKAYFQEINEFSIQIKGEPSLAAAFNQKLMKHDFNSLCEKILMSSQQWRLLISRCTKNGLFLCSEDVRSYSTSIQLIRNSLTAQNQASFDSAPHCSESL